MAHWLVKSEPDTYAFADLLRDGSTTWDGVRNAQAASNLKSMRKGDDVLFYHSGAGPAAVGLATVTKEAFPDPADATGRFVAVELAPGKALKKPVSLAAMKAEPRLAEMKIIRQSRLSVSPIEPTEWAIILAMSNG